MILKASSRGGDAQLAAHLLNTKDNDHVEIHAVNGFMTDDVTDAFAEIRAVAKAATNCRQYLFSLSLSPPENAVVSAKDFEAAISEALNRLGLEQQPHAVIFHEKSGRKHAHLIVSRIDVNDLKAINLPFYKEKLCDLSRELFLRHGWELPQGHIDRKLSDPLNYSLEEKQVADRAEREPQTIKSKLMECWSHSDSKAGFEAALKDAGFQLCRGDRRGFVAVDTDGNIYSLSRWLGVKSKDLKIRLGEPEHLQSIEDGLDSFENEEIELSKDFETHSAKPDPLAELLDEKIIQLEARKAKRLDAHRQARARLREKQSSERIEELHKFKCSKSLLRRLWQWANGKREQLLRERQSELNTQEDKFEAERQSLSEAQRAEMRAFRAKIAELRRQRDAIEPQTAQNREQSQFKSSVDPEFEFHRSQVKRSPEYVLKLLAHMKDRFSRNDIARELSKYLPDANQLSAALATVLNSSELVALNDSVQSKANPRYTTKTYQRLHREMMRHAANLAHRKNHGVHRNHANSAIQTKNKTLKKVANAQLSAEQVAAIKHALKRNDLSCIVGLAGAGKSTLLSAAKDAWEQQGYRVIGGALSGKAADGLQNASAIPSRTLHSWEYSWKHGNNCLSSNDIFVIDEAGMVGTAQLARIINQVHQNGTKLVLVGDPDQLQPIEAGTPFRDISDKFGFAELSEIRRQKAEWQKAASLDLARGRTKEAIQSYEENNMVETASTTHEAIDALVEDYMVDYELHGDDKSRLALAHRRKDVFAINNAIRAARKSAGELQNGVTIKTDHGKREFANGDRILFTRNDHTLGVKNGMLGTIVKISRKNTTVELDQDEKPELSYTIDIDTNQYKSVDHGYATTIHKSQGSTVDHAFVFKSNTMDRHLNYVAMTRHKDQMCVYEQERSRIKFNNSLQQKVSHAHEPEL